MNNKQPEGQQIPIKLTDDLAQGRYANQMMVRHTPEEFVLDFFDFIPGDGQATVVSRVIVSPGHAKRMIAAMEENVKKYEEQFGQIKTIEHTDPKIGFRTE